MGSKYTVLSFTLDRPFPHDYDEVWRGNNVFGAVLAMLRQKKNGSKSIRLEWRP